MIKHVRTLSQLLQTSLIVICLKTQTRARFISVMAGVFWDLKTRHPKPRKCPLHCPQTRTFGILKQDIPSLVSVHCIAHKLELGLQDTLKAISLFREVKEMLQGMWKYSKYSLHRALQVLLCKNYKIIVLRFEHASQARDSSAEMQGRATNYSKKLKSFNPLTPNAPISARTRLHCFKKLQLSQSCEHWFNYQLWPFTRKSFKLRYPINTKILAIFAEIVVWIWTRTKMTIFYVIEKQQNHVFAFSFFIEIILANPKFNGHTKIQS